MSISDVTWNWLYTRGRESVRIVVEGAHLSVFGPGTEERSETYDSEDEALFQQKLLEQRLILRGWGLDRLITDRRSGQERRDGSRGTERRRGNH